MNLNKYSSREELIQQILKLNLFCDNRGNIYCPEYEKYLNKTSGIWQFPDELADFLIYLKDKNIKSFLNIGTYNGLTFNFIADYLNLFNSVKCITIDAFDHKPVKNNNYEYILKTSDDYTNGQFDLVFIDGDHSYEWVKRDYNNVGKCAKYCAFHDIEDEFIKNDKILNGGVYRFWEEIKGDKYLKFTSSKKIKPIMGIGLLYE